MVQPMLKKKGLFLLLVILGMTAPLSIDMYLAAFPLILVDLKTSPQMLSFTLMGFTVCMALGMLLMGALSDKYGRRPVLLGNLLLYIVGSVGCVLTPSIEFFILARMVQAFGAGGMIAIPMAIVKDSFEDHERTKVIATLQMLTILGPTIAPILGAYLIQFFPWQSSFVVLAGIALLSCCLTLCFQETLSKERRLPGGAFSAIVSLGLVFKHRPFMLFLMANALPSMVFMAYLSVSSYIYIQWFALSETAFSFFFAMNSLLLMIAPKLYIRVKPRYLPSQILKITLLMVLIASLFTLSVGAWTPFLFLLCFAPIALSNSFLRAFSTDQLLAQKTLNAGASVSVISFTNVVLGAVGMGLINFFATPQLVFALGVMGALVSVGSLLIVFYFTRQEAYITGYQ